MSGAEPDALVAAILHQQPLHKLLRGGADPNVRDQAGLTPLHHAVLAGNVDAVEALLDHSSKRTRPLRKPGGEPSHAIGSPWHLVTAQGPPPSRPSPLHLAAERSEHLLRLILGHSSLTSVGASFLGITISSRPQADLLQLRDARGWSLLHYAVTRSNLSTLRLLLQYMGSGAVDGYSSGSSRSSSAGGAPSYDTGAGGADHAPASGVDAPDFQGRTPLHQAALLGHAECCKLLLKAGADLAAATLPPEGALPLHLAAAGNHTAVVEILFRHAVTQLGFRTAQTVLLRPNAAGLTALHVAALHSAVDAARRLLQLVYPFDTRGPLGRTALHLAALKGSNGMIQMLLGHSNPQQRQLRDAEGFTAVHLAAAAGRQDALRVLVAGGCNVDARAVETPAAPSGCAGWTALHCAVRRADVATVEMLVTELGADPYARDEAGRTPCDLAVAVATAGRGMGSSGAGTARSGHAALDDPLWGPLQDGHITAADEGSGSGSGGGARAPAAPAGLGGSTTGYAPDALQGPSMGFETDGLGGPGGGGGGGAGCLVGPGGRLDETQALPVLQTFIHLVHDPLRRRSVMPVLGPEAGGDVSALQYAGSSGARTAQGDGVPSARAIGQSDLLGLRGDPAAAQLLTGPHGHGLEGPGPPPAVSPRNAAPTGCALPARGTQAQGTAEDADSRGADRQHPPGGAMNPRADNIAEPRADLRPGALHNCEGAAAPPPTATFGPASPPAPDKGSEPTASGAGAGGLSPRNAIAAVVNTLAVKPIDGLFRRHSSSRDSKGRERSPRRSSKRSSRDRKVTSPREAPSPKGASQRPTDKPCETRTMPSEIPSVALAYAAHMLAGQGPAVTPTRASPFAKVSAKRVSPFQVAAAKAPSTTDAGAARGEDPAAAKAGDRTTTADQRDAVAWQPGIGQEQQQAAESAAASSAVPIPAVSPFAPASRPTPLSYSPPEQQSAAQNASPGGVISTAVVPPVALEVGKAAAVTAASPVGSPDTRHSTHAPVLSVGLKIVPSSDTLGYRAPSPLTGTSPTAPLLVDNLAGLPCVVSPINSPCGFSALNRAILLHRHVLAEALLATLPSEGHTGGVVIVSGSAAGPGRGSVVAANLSYQAYHATSVGASVSLSLGMPMTPSQGRGLSPAQSQFPLAPATSSGEVQDGPNNKAGLGLSAVRQPGTRAPSFAGGALALPASATGSTLRMQMQHAPQYPPSPHPQQPSPLHPLQALDSHHHSNALQPSHTTLVHHHNPTLNHLHPSHSLLHHHNLYQLSGGHSAPSRPPTHLRQVSAGTASDGPSTLSPVEPPREPPLWPLSGPTGVVPPTAGPPPPGAALVPGLLQWDDAGDAFRTQPPNHTTRAWLHWPGEPDLSAGWLLVELVIVDAGAPGGHVWLGLGPTPDALVSANSSAPSGSAAGPGSSATASVAAPGSGHLLATANSLSGSAMARAVTASASALMSPPTPTARPPNAPAGLGVFGIAPCAVINHPYTHVICVRDGQAFRGGVLAPDLGGVTKLEARSGDTVALFWNRRGRNAAFTLNGRYCGRLTGLPAHKRLTPVIGLQSAAFVFRWRCYTSAGLRLQGLPPPEGAIAGTAGAGGPATVTEAVGANVDALMVREQMLHEDPETPWLSKPSMTSLHFAAWVGNCRLLPQLVRAKGFPPDEPDADGWTALHFAALGGQGDAARALLDLGADPDLKTKCGSTPALLAAKYGRSPDHVAVVRMLGDAGAALDVRDARGRTLLMFGAKAGNMAMVQLLLERGLDPSATDCQDREPQQFAGQHGAIFRLLRNAQAAQRAGSCSDAKKQKRAAAEKQTMRPAKASAIAVPGCDCHGAAGGQVGAGDALGRLEEDGSSGQDDGGASDSSGEGGAEGGEGDGRGQGRDIDVQHLPLLAERWRVGAGQLVRGRLIEQGAFGAVFEGTWCGARVAIKQVLRRRQPSVGSVAAGGGAGGGGGANSDAAVGREVASLEREVAILTALPPHERIARMLGSVELPGEGVCLVMAFYPHTLQGVMQSERLRRSWLTPVRRAAIARQLAEGLAFLHGLPGPKVIHRDLKPNNVLLEAAPSLGVKICDFGLSRILAGTDCQSSSAAGHAFWMAPELLRALPYDEKVDVYSYGVILYQLAYWVDDQLYGGLNKAQVDFQVVHGMLRLQDRLPGGIDPDVQAVVRDCLDENPRNRPSMAQVLERLSGYRELPQPGLVSQQVAAGPAEGGVQTAAGAPVFARRPMLQGTGAAGVEAESPSRWPQSQQP